MSHARSNEFLRFVYGRRDFNLVTFSFCSSTYQLNQFTKKVRKTEIHFIINNFLLVESYILSFFLHSKCKFQEASFLYNTEQILLACLYYIGYFLFKSRACLSLRKLKSLHLSTDMNISLTLYTR